MPLRPPAARPAAGFSVVELMIGLAIGLIVVAGALGVYVDRVVGIRGIETQARVTQDLRAAADLIARDLRRAGWWGHSLNGTRVVAAGHVAPANPYSAVQAAGGREIDYTFSRDTAENDALDAGTEQFGFRVFQGRVQMQVGTDRWQDVTDSRTVTVADDGLQLLPTQTTLTLGHFCAKPCLAGTPNCPSTTVRLLQVQITGRAVADGRIVRSTSSAVRLRNDHLQGQCPA